MKNTLIQIVAGTCVFILGSLAANASLVTRLGGQVVYDDDLGISWVADANLAGSNTFGLSVGVSLGTYAGDASGVNGIINADGTMNWPGALFWIDAMNNANYLGFSDWRLPTALNQNGSGPCSGLNCTSSEMGHLFYTEFGATAGTSVLSSGNASELAKFTHIQSYSYQSGTEFNAGKAWGFGFGSGYQGPNDKSFSSYAWAVRTGDVTAVPVPAAVWLFGSGLLGIVSVARRKQAA